MPSIVNGLVLHRKKVLLVRRSMQRRAYSGTWSFPGGHVESGETLEEALVRELGEEIGIVPATQRFLMCLEDAPADGAALNVFHLFVVEQWTGEPRLLGDEHSELRWLEPTDAARLPDLALAGYAEVFAALERLAR